MYGMAEVGVSGGLRPELALTDLRGEPVRVDWLPCTVGKVCPFSQLQPVVAPQFMHL